MYCLINFRFIAVFLIFWSFSFTQLVKAAVTATDLAIVGYDDYSDTFSVMALGTLAAGEVIYFTNNGWNSSLGRFNGADPSQGAGNESLIKLTLNQSIAQGSIISSNASSSAWDWTNSGLIPGQVNGKAEFSDLAFNYQSDQIYAFQGLADNPLLNPTSFIYALQMGSADYPGFSDAVDELTGNIPPGLSEAAKTAFAQTNFSLHGDANGNHSGWALNMNSPDIYQLLTQGGTKEQWLDAISDSANWGPDLSAKTATTAPEPAKSVFLLLGLICCLSRREQRVK